MGQVCEVVRLEGPVHASTDRRAMLDHARHSLGVGDGDPLAPVHASRRRGERRCLLGRLVTVGLLGLLFVGHQ